jgi:hypothetical protein
MRAKSGRMPEPNVGLAITGWKPVPPMSQLTPYLKPALDAAGVQKYLNKFTGIASP